MYINMDSIYDYDSVSMISLAEESLNRWISSLQRFRCLYDVDRNADLVEIINARLSERAAVCPFM